MHLHGPKCPDGPASRKRLRWLAVSAADTVDGEESPAPDESRRAEEHSIRKELVERVRREIAQGTYDTPEKWEKALDRLMDDLERE